MHFVPDDGSKLALLQSIAQRLKSSTVFILVDVFSEKGTREFERMTSIGKCILGRNGYTAAKKAGVARNNYQSIYPIPEPRVLELLQQTGFVNVMRFYPGLWVGS